MDAGLLWPGLPIVDHVTLCAFQVLVTRLAGPGLLKLGSVSIERDRLLIIANFRRQRNPQRYGLNSNGDRRKYPVMSRVLLTLISRVP